MSKESPKFNLNQQVFLVPKFEFQIPAINPRVIQRRTIDELSDGVKLVEYYLDNDINSTKEEYLFGSRKEAAFEFAKKLYSMLTEVCFMNEINLGDIDKSLMDAPHMVHLPINNKAQFEVEDHPAIKQMAHTEESDEEMRKQGYYKNEKGEWEWDRDLATSQEYGEIMQEEIKKCKIETAKKYYDTSELSKEESSRIKSILREFGREDLAENCSDFEGIGCIIDIFVNYFREFGIAKPLDNDNINKFIDEILKSSIHDGNHFYVQEFVSAIAKKSIEIIKG